MKKCPLVVLWIVSAVATIASTEPNVSALIGREIFVEDDWAGQSFTLQRHGDSIEAIWRILGSGVPVVSEQTYPVEVRSEKMCEFVAQVRGQGAELRGPRSQIKIDLSQPRGMIVYLNGVKIHFWEKKVPNQKPDTGARNVAPPASTSHVEER